MHVAFVVTVETGNKIQLQVRLDIRKYICIFSDLMSDDKYSTLCSILIRVWETHWNYAWNCVKLL